MSKLERLKKKVIIEGIILVVFLGLIGTGAYVLSSMHDAIAQEQTQLDASIHTISAQISEEEKKIGVVRSSLEEFNALKSRLDAGGLSIDRSKAEAVLNTLRTKYRVSNFQATVSAEQLITGEGYDGKTVEMSQSDIKMDFNAMSDVHVFSLMEELKTLLPGYVRVYDFSIRRPEKLTPEHFAAMTKGETPALVNAKISAVWIGLRLPQKPKDDAAVPASPPPPAGDD